MYAAAVRSCASSVYPQFNRYDWIDGRNPLCDTDIGFDCIYYTDRGRIEKDVYGERGENWINRLN